MFWLREACKLAARAYRQCFNVILCRSACVLAALHFETPRRRKRDLCSMPGNLGNRLCYLFFPFARKKDVRTLSLLRALPIGDGKLRQPLHKGLDGGTRSLSSNSEGMCYSGQDKWTRRMLRALRRGMHESGYSEKK